MTLRTMVSDAKKRESATNGVNPTGATSDVELVTPEIAEGFMARNDHNRPPSNAATGRLMVEMEQDEWVLNGDPICFDTTGAMINGQHRCRAIMATGIAVPTFVARNLPPDAFKTYDRPKRRGFGDVLAILGEKHSNCLAAAIKWIWRHDRGQMRWKNQAVDKAKSKGGNRHSYMTINVGQGVLDKYPEVRDSVRIMHGARMRLMPGGLAAGLHCLCGNRGGIALAGEFFDRVYDGEGLKKTDSRHVLRGRLLSNKQSKARLSPVDIAALTIKAWNAFVAGEPVTRLGWASAGKRRDPFPEIASA